MTKIIKNANWKDGFWWALLMLVSFSLYQIYYKEVKPDVYYWIKQLGQWGLAGIVFAILTGVRRKSNEGEKS